MCEQTSGNDTAAKFMDQSYESFSIIFGDDESRNAGSMQEIETAHEFTQKARAAKPDDPEIQAQIEEMEKKLTQLTQRKFAGSWWILVGMGIFLLGLMYWNGFSVMSEKIPLLEARQQLPREISWYHTRLKNAEAMPETDEGRAERIEKAKEGIEKYKDMTPEMFKEDWESEKFWEGAKGVLEQIPWIIILALYYFANRAQLFLVLLRDEEAERERKEGGFFKLMLVGVKDVFLGMTVVDRTTTTFWSSGSKTEEWDMMSFMITLGIKIFLPLLLLLAVLYIMRLILPILTLVAYLRNYQHERVDAFWAAVLEKVGGMFEKVSGMFSKA